MIHATYENNEARRRIRLTVTGHAGQAEVGHDIVCASVSILAFTAGRIVEGAHRGGDLLGEPTIRLEKGDAEIDCVPADQCLYREMEAMFYAIETGFSLLAHKYPQFVAFEQRYH